MSHGFCVILTRVFPRCLPEQPSFRRFLQAVVFLLHTNRLFGRKKSNSFVVFFWGEKNPSPAGLRQQLLSRWFFVPGNKMARLPELLPKPRGIRSNHRNSRGTVTHLLLCAAEAYSWVGPLQQVRLQETSVMEKHTSEHLIGTTEIGIEKKRNETKIFFLQSPRHACSPDRFRSPSAAPGCRLGSLRELGSTQEIPSRTSCVPKSQARPMSTFHSNKETAQTPTIHLFYLSMPCSKFV